MPETRRKCPKDCPCICHDTGGFGWDQHPRGICEGKFPTPENTDPEVTP